MQKYPMVCIHSALSSCCTSSRVAPISVIRTNPLMPKVEGNSHETPFQKIGNALNDIRFNFKSKRKTKHMEYWLIEK